MNRLEQEISYVKKGGIENSNKGNNIDARYFENQNRGNYFRGRRHYSYDFLGDQDDHIIWSITIDKTTDGKYLLNHKKEATKTERLIKKRNQKENQQKRIKTKNQPKTI
jgi:hypothetical protein